MQLQSRLPQLIALASARWQQRVTMYGIGRATHVDHRAIRHLGDESLQRLYVGSLRAVCWYFQCQPSAVLQLHASDTPPAFERTHPPSGDMGGEIVSFVSQRIAPFRTTFLVEQLQRSPSAVAALRRQPFIALDVAALAALCHLLQADSLDALLRYDPNLRVHAAATPLDQVAALQADQVTA